MADLRRISTVSSAPGGTTAADDDDDDGGGVSSNGQPQQQQSSADSLPTGRFHRAVWLLFEYPESSTAARIIAIVSVSVILLSIIAFCLETLPQFKRFRVVRSHHSVVTAAAVVGPGNSTGSSPRPDQTTVASAAGVVLETRPRTVISSQNVDDELITRRTDSSEQPVSSIDDVDEGLTMVFEEDDMPTLDEPFFVIETVCVVWFTSEVAIRFAASPNRLRFFGSLMNVIDVIAIVPYFITLSTMWTEPIGTSAEDDGSGKNMDDGQDMTVSQVANNQVLMNRFLFIS